MGVMSCSRANCDNVMCDYHSGTFGYICYSCKDELIDTRGTVTIGEFMRTPKQEYKRDDSYAWESYIDRTFERIED